MRHSVTNVKKDTLNRRQHMIQYTVIVEDKDGNEVEGRLESSKIPKEDQLVTIKNSRGTYTSGFILEIITESINE